MASGYRLRRRELLEMTLARDVMWQLVELFAKLAQSLVPIKTMLLIAFNPYQITTEAGLGLILAVSFTIVLFAFALSVIARNVSQAHQDDGDIDTPPYKSSATITRKQKASRMAGGISALTFIFGMSLIDPKITGLFLIAGFAYQVLSHPSMLSAATRDLLTKKWMATDLTFLAFIGLLFLSIGLEWVSVNSWIVISVALARQACVHGSRWITRDRRPSGSRPLR